MEQSRGGFVHYCGYSSLSRGRSSTLSSTTCVRSIGSKGCGHSLHCIMSEDRRFTSMRSGPWDANSVPPCASRRSPQFALLTSIRCACCDGCVVNAFEPVVATGGARFDRVGGGPVP